MSKPNTLDRLKKVAKKAVSAATKKSGMRELSVPQALEPRVMSCIELGSVYDELKPQFEQHKTSVGEELFQIYTQEMWDNKKHPENFKVVIRREDGMKDASANFILKFNKNGCKKKFEGDLPEDKTLADVIHDSLMAVGLSEKNARAFFLEEIIIKEDYEFVKPINELLDEPEGSLAKSAAQKIMAYGAARPSRSHGSKEAKVTLPAMTDEEEASIYSLKTVVLLKEGLEERIWNYAENITQLRKLMLFCGCSDQVSNFEFAISDEASVKSRRMAQVAEKYLSPISESN